MTLPGSRFSSAAATLVSLRAFAGRHSKLVRLALYLYVVLVACPVRHWPLETGIDETWRFALNYAPAHGLVVGTDTVFTSGPLGYLMFPQDVGANLVRALLAQAALWLLLAAVFADIFFRGGFPLRNLALFSFCFGLSGPLFWFDYLGTENLMLAAALMLIVMFHWRGSLARYVTALVLVGLLPLLKLTSGMIGIAALAGFLVDRAIERRWKALPEVALTALIPPAVTALVCLFVFPSAPAFRSYLRGSAELIGGFSAAMSYPGSPIELVSALEAAVVLAILLGLQAGTLPQAARFYALLIAIPLFVSFKHGFIRQDNHIVNFFCFVALALALVSLTVNLQSRNARRVASLVILFFVIWQDNVGRYSEMSAVNQATGRDSLWMLWGALRFNRLRQRQASAISDFPEHSRIEPALIDAIGDSPIASMSFNFTNLAAARLRLALYPVVQRYSAYTPYLDGLNADWIREKRPRFLLFDGEPFDERDPWAETPAMWLEVYRWYNTRLLGPRNLLLERRAEPRFTGLETIARYRIAFPGELRLPVSRDPVFWTMKCDYSVKGRLQKLLFRIPSVFISVHETSGITRTARVIPAVLASPVLGNYLPGALSQFAALFQPGVDPGYSVDRILFQGPGTSSYTSTCEVETLRPAR
jgi:hypothetical protein